MKLLIFVLLFFISNLEAQNLESFSSYFENSTIGQLATKESEHFKVSWVHPRDALLADVLLQHMEAAYEKLRASFGAVMKAQKKVPIEIFPDLKSFSDLSKLSLSRFRATGTIALTLDQRLMLLSPRNLAGGYSWAETAVHEYIHYLIREISPQLIPIWLHEGAAQLFQAYPYEIRPQLKPSQWGLFKRRREQNQLLNLKTLQEPFPYRETPEEAELAYIQSFLFVNWLDKKCGIVPLLQSIENLKSTEKGLEQCTGKSISHLDAEFIPALMADIQVPSGADVEWYARDFSGRDPMDIEGTKADRKSRNYAQLSTELFRQGRYQAAAIEMEKALRETPVAPPSWRRHLALSLQNSNQTAKSQKILNKLLQDYPEDAAAWYLLGLQQSSSKDWKSAWKSFLHSFYQNPFLEGLEQEMERLQARQPEFKDRFLLRDL